MCVFTVKTSVCSPPLQELDTVKVHHDTELVRRRTSQIKKNNGCLVTKTKKEKNKSCPGMKLTLVEHEPGVAVLLLVSPVETNRH